MSRAYRLIGLWTALLAVGLGVSAGPAAAQDAGPDPAPPAAQSDDGRWWEYWVDGYRWLTDRGVHPDAGVVVAGSSLAFGARFHDLHVAGSPVGFEVGGMWSLRGYQEYTLRLGLIDRISNTLSLRPADAKFSSQFNEFDAREPGLALYLEVVARDYPRMNFYGIGPGVDVEDRADFALRGYSADVVVQHQREAPLALAARVGVLSFDIGRGTNDSLPDVHDAFAPGAVPGLTERPTFFTAGLAVAADDRDSPNVPTSGRFVSASIWWMEPVGDEAFTTARFTLDARTFLTPVSDRDVLALRGVLASDISREPTPFYLQHYLGGSDALRGYSSYVFRDDALAFVSAEYRWRVLRLLEIVPFVDIGVVGESIARLRGGGVHATPGLGFRVRNDDRVWGRMDIGYRPGSVRFAFSLDPPF